MTGVQTCALPIYKNLLLSDAEYMGIALVQEPKSEFKTFWTLVLGTPM